jgi:hypothetical protein
MRRLKELSSRCNSRPFRSAESPQERPARQDAGPPPGPAQRRAEADGANRGRGVGLRARPGPLRRRDRGGRRRERSGLVRRRPGVVRSRTTPTPITSSSTRGWAAKAYPSSEPHLARLGRISLTEIDRTEETHHTRKTTPSPRSGQGEALAGDHPTPPGKRPFRSRFLRGGTGEIAERSIVSLTVCKETKLMCGDRCG